MANGNPRRVAINTAVGLAVVGVVGGVGYIVDTYFTTIAHAQAVAVVHPVEVKADDAVAKAAADSRSCPTPAVSRRAQRRTTSPTTIPG